MFVLFVSLLYITIQFDSRIFQRNRNMNRKIAHFYGEIKCFFQPDKKHPHITLIDPFFSKRGTCRFWNITQKRLRNFYEILRPIMSGTRNIRITRSTNDRSFTPGQWLSGWRTQTRFFPFENSIYIQIHKSNNCLFSMIVIRVVDVYTYIFQESFSNSTIFNTIT